MAQETIDKTPSEKQVKFLRYLGHTGPIPATSAEASTLISELKAKKSGSVIETQQPTVAQPTVEPSIPLPSATEEDLKYNEGLLEAAGRFDRLAVYRLTKKGIPLRGDIVNAERNFLVNLERLRTANQ